MSGKYPILFISCFALTVVSYKKGKTILLWSLCFHGNKLTLKYFSVALLFYLLASFKCAPNFPTSKEVLWYMRGNGRWGQNGLGPLHPSSPGSHPLGAAPKGPWDPELLLQSLLVGWVGWRFYEDGKWCWARASQYFWLLLLASGVCPGSFPTSVRLALIFLCCSKSPPTDTSTCTSVCWNELSTSAAPKLGFI